MSFAQPRESGETAGLPRRRAGSAPSASPTGRGSSGLLDVIEDALRDVSGKDPNVYGMLVASTDGLMLASDTRDVHVDTVAAMAAAAASIAAQFTDQADVGESRASMFEGASGFVGVFPVEPSVLLVVFGQKDMTMGLFNVAARNALTRLQQSLERQRVLKIRMARKVLTEDAKDSTAAEAE